MFAYLSISLFFNEFENPPENLRDETLKRGAVAAWGKYLH